jgi:hypothetical protein
VDKVVRNRIQRATQSARVLLEREFAEQLEGVYDIRKDGSIAQEPGSHLDGTGRLVREKLVAAVGRHVAGGSSQEEAVAAYRREAAFTCVNRCVALKMLEARGLVQECIARGEESSGFKEFGGLAPGMVRMPDHGYQLYLDSLFDEIGQEVGVLFDRRDPAGLLWPRRRARDDLFAVLNDQQLQEIWDQDETIGWVYQYFNSKEERELMRDVKRGGSQAPRNSRELAVRNQFFTPRYVVQFLTENTLGRLWYEMRGGQTLLAEGWEFLVLSPEQPLRPRPGKDPRDLRVLDPACGSGHFLLYSFDLLLDIYEEAWADESFDACSEVTGKTLRDDYPDFAALRRAAPSLIVEHNLHGVDIDPRCTQIAALALWLRAQRAWKEADIPAADRPLVQRTHIVVAEPIPGDAALVEEFAEQLNPPFLRDLFKKIVGEVSLAGELGALLQVDRGITVELNRAREVLVKQRQGTISLSGMESTHTNGELDISGMGDDGFFREAEERIVEALRDFAETASGGVSVRRRLFAGDATQGIALVDLLRSRFDVVLMNPPFGRPISATNEYIRSAYGGAHSDIYACFIRRCRELLDGGYLGAITSRSFLLTPRLESFRSDDIIPRLVLLADLGLGVMDNAYVESAAYVVGGGSAPRFAALDCRRGRIVDPTLVCSDAFSNLGHLVERSIVTSLPQKKILYSLPSNVAQILQTQESFEPQIGTAREGMKSFENERFVRLAWEVSAGKIGKTLDWHWFAKGGSHAFFWAPPHLVLRWTRNGAELKAVNERINGSTAQVNQASAYWYRPGLTYSKRSSKGFSARVLPADTIFSSNGPAILPEGIVSVIQILGWINSRFVRALLHLQSNFGDFSTGAIKRLPWSEMDSGRLKMAMQRTEEVLKCFYYLSQRSETEQYFVGPQVGGFEEVALQSKRLYDEAQLRLAESIATWDRAVTETYGVNDLSWADDLLAVPESEEGPEPTSDDDREDARLEEKNNARGTCEALVSWAAGVAFGRFDVRLVTGARPLPDEPEPFDPLPVCCPATLTGDDGLPLISAPVDYPLAFPEDGILVDDPGHPRDITAAVRAVFEVVFDDRADAMWQEAAALLSPKDHDLRTWLASAFFEHHLKLYSRSRRKAPILWQLGVPSGRYSVWLYAHRLTGDSLFQVQRDVVEPKLIYEERQLTNLVQEAGNSPSSRERKQIAAQEDFLQELRVLLEEVKSVAPMWNPTLDDGVVLTMAPLWRLVPQHKAWQRELRSKWEELASGKYDWAHLAMHLWPERVTEKCVADRSLAIAHGLDR